MSAVVTPEQLKEIVNKASYLSLHNELKRQLQQVFEEATYFAFERGLFKATPEFLLYIETSSKTMVPFIVVDTKQTPIQIEDVEGFIESAKQTYQEAVNRYHADYTRLRQNRKNEDFFK